MHTRQSNVWNRAFLACGAILFLGGVLQGLLTSDQLYVHYPKTLGLITDPHPTITARVWNLSLRPTKILVQPEGCTMASNIMQDVPPLSSIPVDYAVHTPTMQAGTHRASFYVQSLDDRQTITKQYSVRYETKGAN